jgi:hypothetical protein
VLQTGGTPVLGRVLQDGERKVARAFGFCLGIRVDRACNTGGMGENEDSCAARTGSPLGSQGPTRRTPALLMRKPFPEAITVQVTPTRCDRQR